MSVRWPEDWSACIALEDIHDLETALRQVADTLDHTDGQPNSWVVTDAVTRLRAVLK